VTKITYMPLASAEFMRIGVDVVEAKAGQPTMGSEMLLVWLPSASNLELSQLVLRESLEKLTKKFKHH